MPLLKRLERLDWPILVAELVLTFVGITAALWFGSMKEWRAERRREVSACGPLALVR